MYVRDSMDELMEDLGCFVTCPRSSGTNLSNMVIGFESRACSN